MNEAQAEEGAGFGWILNHIPKILWHRRYWVIGSFVSLTTIATVAAFALPTLYRSTASLLVQSQELPTELVQAPASGAIEQRIARIREQVLSRGDLIRLIEQFNLYPDERQSKPMSKIVEKMRDATIVGAQENDLGTEANKDTIALDISFDYRDPSQAQAVMQSYVDSFLTQDTEDVSEQARLSVRFLEDQANKLRGQIASLENQLTTLKSQNGAALANTGAAPIMDLGSYSSQITSLETQNRQLLAQAGRAPQKDPQLAQAEAALAAAQSLYNDSHPDVQTARERLRAVQQMVRNNPSADEGAIIRSQIAANNSAINQLQQARSSAMAQAQASLAGSARAPAIMERAMQLENQASALREQYKTVSDNLLKAQTGARLANEQRAERLSLVEPPSLPDRPNSPDRPLLIAIGAVLGLGLGFALAILVEVLRRPLRSPAQINGLGLPVLGVVPLLTEKKKPRWSLPSFKRKKPRLA